MRRFVAVLNGLLTALVVAAAAAAAASLAQAQHPGLEMLAQFAPVYAGVGLLGLVWAVVARRGPVAAAAVLALAAGGWLVAPEFTRDAGPTAPPGAPGQVKVIQFNILRGNPNREAIARWLEAERADFVTLTEVTPEMRDFLYRRGWQVAGARSDLMIFTRAPYLRMDRPRPPAHVRITFINATYATASGEAELFTTHVNRWTPDGRAAMPSRLATLTQTCRRGG
jgi:endonuclease/exonuclease/phosphatase (EEP) superfamily protein YafD